MKYVIAIIVVLALLFGIQAYINNSRTSAPSLLQSETGSTNTGATSSDVVKSDVVKNNNQKTMEQDKIEIKDVTIGTGVTAEPGKKITVHYTGTFIDGKVFDSSVSRGEPFTFTLGAGQVIAGWDQGFAGMKVGGERKLVIPPQFGYGMQDYGPIPGGSTLLFDVKLLSVE